MPSLNVSPGHELEGKQMDFGVFFLYKLPTEE